MTYSPQTWADNDPRYPLSAARLAHIEAGIAAAGTGGGGGGIQNPLTADLDGGGFNITNIADVTLTGLTGATAGARFAGGTSSGAPVSGTFAVGDLIVSRADGKIYVCTVAGTPGTWVAATGTVANPMTADLDAGTHKITNAGAASASTDIPIFSQVPVQSAPTAVKTANYAAAAADIVVCDTSGGSFAVTLPTAPTDKTVIAVVLVTAGSKLSIVTGGSDVFHKSGGPTSVFIAQATEALVIQYKSSGAIWYVVSGLPRPGFANVQTVTQSATPAINTDAMNVASITALAQAITSMTTNLTGTPVDGQSLIVRLTDNGTGRAITWGASFASTTVTLPTTTVASTMLRVGFFWNAATSKWDCVAVA